MNFIIWQHGKPITITKTQLQLLWPIIELLAFSLLNLVRHKLRANSEIFLLTSTNIKIEKSCRALSFWFYVLILNSLNSVLIESDILFATISRSPVDTFKYFFNLECQLSTLELVLELKCKWPFVYGLVNIFS